MIEKVVNGIKYLLNEETLTAEIVENEGNGSKINIPEIVVFNEVSYRVTCIKEKGFSGYPSLTSIIIPDSVTSIGEGTFLDCESLEEVVIGNSVTSIGGEAFCRCEMLTDIRFRGTIAQWRKIELGNGWNDDVSATVVRCTNGNVNI